MHDEFTSIFTNVLTALTVNHEIKPEVMNFSFVDLIDLNIFYYSKIHLHKWIRQEAMPM